MTNYIANRSRAGLMGPGHVAKLERAGTIKNIVAGGNISVDNSDPANPVISADEPGDNSVTNAMLAEMVQATIKGRAAGAGTGDPEDLTAAQVLAILKAVGAYAKDNIIGNVSQLSGVPTGAIIEDGNNPNGRYVKWANGTMHCMAALATSATADVTWTFPEPFVEVPALFCGPTTNAAALVGAFFRNGATTTSADFAGYNASGRIALSCTQLAVGRWF